MLFVLRSETLKVEHSLEVIELVLQGLSHQALPLNLDQLPLQGEALRYCVGVALPQVGQPGNREATLRHLLWLTPDLHQARVQQIPHRPVNVVTKRSQADPNLVGGNARPTRKLHRVKQISDEVSGAWCTHVNRVSRARENGVAKQSDGTLRHWRTEEPSDMPSTTNAASSRAASRV